jgi:hypothetical protein
MERFPGRRQDDSAVEAQKNISRMVVRVTWQKAVVP